ncbi:MAG TPA: sigma factor [Patescibacteria group bacterium]|nr:sigma factor [Patescibacteria group bacterium]
MDRVSLSEEEKDRFARSLLQHLDALYSFAWWLTHHREEIEDLVQETCLRALRSAHQFEPGTNRDSASGSADKPGRQSLLGHPSGFSNCTLATRAIDLFSRCRFRRSRSVSSG